MTSHINSLVRFRHGPHPCPKMASLTMSLAAPTRACPCGCANGLHGKVAGTPVRPVAPRMVNNRRVRNVRVEAVKTTAAAATKPTSYEVKYVQSRMETIKEHFPTAYTIDDLLLRIEMALCAFGFNGENSIGE